MGFKWRDVDWRKAMRISGKVAGTAVPVIAIATEVADNVIEEKREPAKVAGFPPVDEVTIMKLYKALKKDFDAHDKRIENLERLAGGA